MTKIFSLQLPDEYHAALEGIAKDKDRSKGYLVRGLIGQYIQDYMDVKRASKILKDIDSGKRKLVDWKDVQKHLYDND